MSFSRAMAAAGGRSHEQRHGRQYGRRPDAKLPAEIVVVEDAPALAEAAARRLIKRVCGKDRAAVALTGGSSPQGLYRLLAEEPWRGEVPWHRVHWFIGDDRFVPETDPLSNMGNGATPVSRPRARTPAKHPSDGDGCQLSGRRGAAL